MRPPLTLLAETTVPAGVPTLDESGVCVGSKDLTFEGIVAPAGTPPVVMERLRAAIAKAVNDVELTKRFPERAPGSWSVVIVWLAGS